MCVCIFFEFIISFSLTEKNKRRVGRTAKEGTRRGTRREEEKGKTGDMRRMDNIISSL